MYVYIYMCLYLCIYVFTYGNMTYEEYSDHTFMCLYQTKSHVSIRAFTSSIQTPSDIQWLHTYVGYIVARYLCSKTHTYTNKCMYMYVFFSVTQVYHITPSICNGIKSPVYKQLTYMSSIFIYTYIHIQDVCICDVHTCLKYMNVKYTYIYKESITYINIKLYTQKVMHIFGYIHMCTYIQDKFSVGFAVYISLD